jgi:hypothetical protein
MSIRRPNLFDMGRVDYMNVVLKVEDLLDADATLSRADAEQLIQQHGSKIATAMIRAGIETAIRLKRASEQ